MWVQHRGTCIGNQISPILSVLPVLQKEVAWRSTFPGVYCDAALITRCVDNRLVLAPA